MSLGSHLGVIGWIALPVFAHCILAAAVEAVDWQRVQELKKGYIQEIARRAIEQQLKTASEPVAIAFPDDVQAFGDLEITDHSAGSLSLTLNAAPRQDDVPAAEHVRFRLPEPLDMVSKHSGLAFTIRTEAGTSPEVRLGCRLIGKDGRRAVMLPAIPALSNWGENPNEVYFDWAFLNFADAADAIEALRSVHTIELTAASRKRTPERGPSDEARPAAFTITDLRLVDYMKGSFDDRRNDRDGAGRPDLTLQHRTQECAGVVACFGGERGLRAAVDALDMCLRTQCWDGSFLDGRRGARTVVSAEYTHGFTLYGMVPAYKALEEAKSPLLDETVTLGPITRTRREFYQDMFYRAALSRGILPPSEFQDDIIGGDKMMSGANRPEGFATAMRMIAGILSDPERAEHIHRLHEAYTDYMVEAQGKYSGGFPLLAEGDRYDGRGIHYDAGYITSQMKRIIAGMRAAPDPRMITILDRYQDVFEAAMDKEGMGLRRLISERTGGDHASLSTPDATAQVALQHNLPVLAQWAYNCHRRAWEGEEDELRNTWVSFSRSSGYGLGTFVSVCLDDMDPEPQPRDLGYLFPRQFPVWSSRLYTKDGQLQRTSRMIVRPDGPQISDFWIEVGEYPATVGVPVLIESPEGEVAAVAESLSGWPRLLPADAAVELSGGVAAKGQVGQAFEIKLEKETRIVITGPKVSLPPEAGGKKVPFRAELTLTPSAPLLPVRLTVLAGTVPYEVRFVAPHVLKGLPSGADVALARNGGEVDGLNRRMRGAGRMIDGDSESTGVVRGLSGLEFRVGLGDEFALDCIVFVQAQFGPTEERRLARAKDVVVTPSVGEPRKLTLEDRAMEPQEFALGGVEADGVTIEVRTTYPAVEGEEDVGGFASVQILKR